MYPKKHPLSGTLSIEQKFRIYTTAKNFTRNRRVIT